MYKFKRVFYPVYIITIILVCTVSFNIMDALTLFQHWGFWKYFNELPFIGRNLMLFLAVLMTVEIIIENISIYSLRKSTKDHDEEVKSLKAKLYDKSQEEAEEEKSFDFDDDDEDDD